ncbi:hypothetical protein [Herbaspirillum autotrophicum]|uniref:hypothetical protein n=1 Tax=Herbaspirillum autotrophicum TaxID=180195 RepID=UPI00067D177E|nr:hypothetical protein [Herbaspirillum autotrophicum]
MGNFNKQYGYYDGLRLDGDTEYPDPPDPREKYTPDGVGGWTLMPTPVPYSVTPLQARRALLAAGLLSAVEEAVAAGDEATKLAWQFSTAVERGSQFVALLATTIGLTDEQVDDLFCNAVTFV